MSCEGRKEKSLVQMNAALMKKVVGRKEREKKLADDEGLILFSQLKL